MASMIRRAAFLALCFVGAVLIWTCGPPAPPTCQTSNCSGCCAADGACLGQPKQSPQACGSAGAACKVCLSDQLCSGGRCLHDPDAGLGGGGGGTGGGATGGGGGTAGGSGGGAGGGAACGQQGQTCCNGFQCTAPLLCQQATCHAPPPDAGPCGLVGQPCCNRSVCFGAALCGILGNCIDPPDAGPPDSGVALSPLGDPCNVSGTCADGLCQVQDGFTNGSCTRTCATQGDCPSGSQCSSYPGRSGGLVCLKNCSPAGQVGGCRAGYVCEQANSSLSGFPVCVPACTAPACAGATCDGRGFCCGAAGRACCNGATCDATSACTGGYCVQTACGGANQPCCAGSTCNGPGLTCAGSACALCGQLNQPCCGGACASSALACAAGTCVTCGSGGTTCPVGEACTAPSQCAGAQCIAGTGGVGWAGGYCSQLCPPACPAGTACSAYIKPPSSYCSKLCDWDGGAGGCRAGYICERNLLPTAAQGVCYTACQSSAECRTATLSLQCQSGFCCGAQYYRCCSGATPCPVSGTCGALGYCQ